MLKTGYAKNDDEYQQITTYFNNRMPEFKLSELGFREKLWLYKSHLWYNFLVQDFLTCYKYATKWVDLFHKNEPMISLNPVFFLKGYNYLLESLYHVKYHSKYKKALSEFEYFIDTSTLLPQDDNVKALRFLYLYSHKLNLHFFEGTLKEVCL